MSDVIYIPLQEGDADCWRPVHAERLSKDVYEITVDDEPGDEHWGFPPHAKVRCRDHAFSDGKVGLIAFELAE